LISCPSRDAGATGRLIVLTLKASRGVKIPASDGLDPTGTDDDEGRRWRSGVIHQANDQVLRPDSPRDIDMAWI
jgi:hypothetical protein